jgi:hypothetical protein
MDIVPPRAKREHAVLREQPQTARNILRFFRKKTCLVMLRAKTITADAVIPLCMEIKAATPECRIVFLVPNDSWPGNADENGTRTWNILKKNTVLHEAMLSVGEIRLFHCHHNPYEGELKGQILRIMDALWVCFVIFLSGNIRLLHFVEPGNRLMKLANGIAAFFGKRYAVESRLFVGESMMRIEQKHKGEITQDSSMYADAVLSFSRTHAAMERGNVETYLLGCSHQFPAWVSFVRERGRLFYKSFYGTHPHLKDKKVVVFCLSIVDIQPGYGDSEMRLGRHGMRQLFFEAMDVLYSHAKDLVVFLKPHYITNMEVLRDHLASMSGDSFHITYEHPEVLLSGADLQISCNFSTTLWMGRIMGVPTVEYADYSDRYLQFLRGNAYEPDAVSFFINNNQVGLDAVVQSLIQESLPRTAMREIFPEVNLTHIRNDFWGCRDDSPSR